MRLVPPLHPEGPEGPAKQGAGVAPLCQAPEHYGWWQLVLCPSPPPPLHQRPAGRQQEGLGGQEAAENGWNGGDMQYNQLL